MLQRFGWCSEEWYRNYEEDNLLDFTCVVHSYATDKTQDYLLEEVLMDLA